MGRMSADQINATKRKLLRQIGGSLVASQISRGEFYKKIRMANSTFKTKECDPGRFSLDELFSIANALNMHLYISIGKEESI